VEQYRALLGENNGGDPGTKRPGGYRVEVTYGTGALGPDDGAGGVDVAVMDNFIFGGPQEVK